MIPYSSHYWFVFMAMCSFTCALIMSLRNRSQMLRGNKFPVLGLILAVLCCWYVGVRPINKEGDSYLYSTVYNLTLHHKLTVETAMGNETEGFWAFVELSCLQARLSASQWFQIISAFYFVGFSIAIWKWMRRNFTSAFIFMISSMSFWAYATNGLRSGMAASLGTCALAFLTNAKSRKDLLSIGIAIALFFCSSLTHSSMWLFFAIAIMVWLKPTKKVTFYFWSVCLLLSPFISNLMLEQASTIFSDARLDYYSESDMSVFSRTGWRWDFILYSAIPVIWSWYIINVRKLSDKTYLIISNVYVLCNSTWLLVNSVPYSNRFAYIGWCIYPFVLCYPLFKMNISKYQGAIGASMMVFFTILTLLLT